MPTFDTNALAQEFLSAFQTGEVIPLPPSSRYPDFDLAAAYAVEAEFSRLRQQSGRQTVGRKVGYANKAVWRVLKLQTLLWAHMYDDTVQYAEGNSAALTLPYDRSSKIEPEIVFKLSQPLADRSLDAAAVLHHVEWMAIGFEIIDCPYPEWQFKPADFVAAFGLHLRLVVGPTLPITPELIPAIAEGLAGFKLRALKNGQLVEEGSGKNSLRSPALCLAELSGWTSLSAGELVSTGTLTAGHAVTRGETWQIEIDGLPLSSFSLQVG